MANANNYINNSRFFTAKEFIRLIDLFDNVDNGGMKLMFMTLIGGFMKYFFLFLTETSLRLKNTQVTSFTYSTIYVTFYRLSTMVAYMRSQITIQFRLCSHICVLA